MIESVNINSRRTLLARSLQIGICMSALAATAAPAQTSPTVPWTTAWAVAPEQGGSTTDFEKVTLRQAIRPSMSGSAARIRISNLFGNQSLKISDAHFAQSQGT